ncbi:hypothetical protein JQC92_00210 [Shewanella sp. 202IG2-18]|uniref:hypothetical protein n=1 Tax=Parashewanella hymeniacidonis TaxID=2807618 RepID=UPI0019621C09|nr:hypothetical protein [Parashewanella hymeniacidonis]MBM7070476.1 hypothetical protein [Parashewanella hymeniacidonis]
MLPRSGYKALLLVIVAALIAGCSSTKTAEEQTESLRGRVKDSFSTEVKDNGLKLFTYKAWKVRAQNALVHPLPHENRISNRKKSRRQLKKEYEAYKKREKDWELAVELGLERTLKQTGYCKNGFYELNRTVLHETVEIRGECKEGAK